MKADRNWMPPPSPHPSAQRIVGMVIAWLIVACVIAALCVLLGWLVELAFG